MSFIDCHNNKVPRADRNSHGFSLYVSNRAACSLILLLRYYFCDNAAVGLNLRRRHSNILRADDLIEARSRG